MFCGVSEVHDIRKHKSDSAGEKHRLVHAETVRHRAADENPNSNADIPAAKVRAVGGAALVMAGKVHAHRLVAGENETKACTDEERCKEKHDGAVAESQDEICNNVQRHPGADEMNKVSFVDEATRHDAVQNEARRDEGVKPSRAANAKLLGV